MNCLSKRILSNSTFSDEYYLLNICLLTYLLDERMAKKFKQSFSSFKFRTAPKNKWSISIKNPTSFSQTNEFVQDKRHSLFHNAPFNYAVPVEFHTNRVYVREPRWLSKISLTRSILDVYIMTCKFFDDELPQPSIKWTPPMPIMHKKAFLLCRIDPISSNELDKSWYKISVILNVPTNHRFSSPTINFNFTIDQKENDVSVVENEPNMLAFIFLFCT